MKSSCGPLGVAVIDWLSVVSAEGLAAGKPGTDQVPSHRLRTLRTAFNASRKRRYDDAMAALQTIPRAATLCACRFQPPLKTNEEARVLHAPGAHGVVVVLPSLRVYL